MMLLRWLLLPAMFALGIGAGVVVGLLGLTGLDRLCPPDQMVSGVCIAPWYPQAEAAVTAGAAALAALLAVLLPARAAPTYRPQVALVALGVGTVMTGALWVAGGRSFSAAGLAAVATGIGAAAWARRLAT